MNRAVAAAGLSVLLAGAPVDGPSAGASATPRKLVAPPRCLADEHWELSIRLLGMTAAEAEVDIPGGCTGTDLRMLARARTTRVVRLAWRVNDTLECRADTATGRTRTCTYVDDENGTREERQETYADGAVLAHFRTPSGEHDARVDAPDGTRDPLTVLMLLRAQPLEPGDVYVVPIFSRSAVYQGTVRVMERGRLEDPDGRLRPTVRLRATFTRGGAPSRVHADIHLSDDADRLPLRVVAGTRYGHLTGILTRATRRTDATVGPAPGSGTPVR